jgi:hypothetical protein
MLVTLNPSELQPRFFLGPSGASERPEDTLRYLLEQPEARKQLAKLRYADEWAQSLAESHPSTPALKLTQEQFWDEVRVLRSAFSGVLGHDLDDLLRRPDVHVGTHPTWF